MAALLLVALVALPLVEIYLIVQMAQSIGGWSTLGLLLAAAVGGAALVKHEGRRAWTALRASVEQGRPPDRSIADAGLTLVGGLLLFVPGFMTDVAGLALILPPTRRLGRLLVGRAVRRRATRNLTAMYHGAGAPPGSAPGSPAGRGAGGVPGPAMPGPVIPGEVITAHDEPPTPGHRR